MHEVGFAFTVVVNVDLHVAHALPDHACERLQQFWSVLLLWIKERPLGWLARIVALTIGDGGPALGPPAHPCAGDGIGRASPVRLKMVCEHQMDGDRSGG